MTGFAAWMLENDRQPHAGIFLGATLAAHVLWWFFYSRQHSKIFDLGGKGLLFVMRAVTLVLGLETVLSSMILPAQHIKYHELDVDVSEWDVHNLTVSDSKTVTHTINFGILESTDTDVRKGLTLLYVPANGALFEEMAEFLEAYMHAMHAERVVGFNFRGCGLSTGRPYSSQDLVADAEAVLEYLVKVLEVDTRKVIVHGQSLGGAVALGLRKLHPELIVVSDRSFRSLSSAAVSMVEEPTAAVPVGLLFALLLAITLHGDDFAGLRMTAKIVGMVLALCFGMLGMLPQITPQLLTAAGWDFQLNNPEVLYSSPLVVLYHENDGVLGYDKVSLHPIVDLSNEMVTSIKLEYEYSGNPKHNHMYPVTTSPNELQQLLQSLGNILDQREKVQIQ